MHDSLPIYESKLRDILGLRKKMKSEDWRSIYQHYVNSGTRHTALYLNGTRIQWNKAWKEIRRSHARDFVNGKSLSYPENVLSTFYTAHRNRTSEPLG